MFGEFTSWVDASDNRALTDELRAIEGRRREDEARQAVLLAELERRGAHRDDENASMWGLLRPLVHWSDRECKERMRVAHLVDEYPDVGEALFEHQISVANATEIARARANPRIGDHIETKIGEFTRLGERLEYDDLREKVRSWEKRTDAAHEAEQATTAHERRNAHIHVDDERAAGELVAEFGLLDAIEIREILAQYIDAEWRTDWDATVEQHGDDASTVLMPRTHAQRSADAVKQIFIDAASRPPGSKAPEPITVVHLDYQSFNDILVRAELLPESLGDPFDDPEPHVGERLCHADHGDPLDPDTVLQLLLAGYIRFAIYDDAGIPIHWGTKKRLFTGAARDAVRSLSTRCTQPGCRVRTRRTQTDHTVEFARGGPTDPDNGNIRCNRHNLLKNKGYTVTRDALGQWHTHRPDGTEVPY